MLGRVYIEGCSEDLDVSFFFFSLYFKYITSCILVLWPFWHTLYLYLFYIYWCMFFHLSLHVLFLFYLYTHVSYILYAIYYFCFTQRCHDEFCLKCFRNTSYQSLLAINSLLAKFLRVCVRIDFIVLNKWVWVECLITSLICSFVCCDFVTNCQRGRMLGHMWFTC